MYIHKIGKTCSKRQYICSIVPLDLLIIFLLILNTKKLFFIHITSIELTKRTKEQKRMNLLILFCNYLHHKIILILNNKTL